MPLFYLLSFQLFHLSNLVYPLFSITICNFILSSPDESTVLINAKFRIMYGKKRRKKRRKGQYISSVFRPFYFLVNRIFNLQSSFIHRLGIASLICSSLSLRPQYSHLESGEGFESLIRRSALRLSPSPTSSFVRPHRALRRCLRLTGSVPPSSSEQQHCNTPAAC